MVLAHGGGRGQHPGLPCHGLRVWEGALGSAACEVRLTPSRPLELTAAVWFGRLGDGRRPAGRKRTCG